ncbi:hypothetical protein [Saccharopolyspora hattusasensis]|uniref:hypothetical protein n=1 Tax=Saccharopolyspora hattusasensis TaxID=1128679 RepID=UPI003D9964D6
MLIVLDNCEHLVTAAAQMVNAVLPAAPGVRVLATSREPLNVPGEQVFPVPPLGVPRLDTSGGGVGQYEAVTLFAERGAAALPGFRVDRENEPAVARLCQRLDGLPLAIDTGSTAAAGAVRGTDPATSGEPVPAADRRAAGRAAATSDAAGGDRMELRSVLTQRADALGAAVGVRR